MIEFQKYPKTPRLFRNCVITEKLDGTNVGLHVELEPVMGWEDEATRARSFVVDGQRMVVAAQSRNRMVTPEDDNHGFARWAYENAEVLARTLGPGVHFGEWWGQGIQRRYDMDYKKFSLFNVARWGDLEVDSPLPSLGVVPTLYEGRFTEEAVRVNVQFLEACGSVAAPGFMNPEGVIVYHKDSGQVFKVTLVNDEEPKGVRR